MKKVLKGLLLGIIAPFHFLLSKKHSHKLSDGTREPYSLSFFGRIGNFLLMVLLWPYVIYTSIKIQFKSEVSQND